MAELTIREEPIDASGPRSIVLAAEDELARRYGQADDAAHLSYDELAPPLGFFLVAREDGHLAGGVGLRVITEPSARVGEVKRLWVRPDLRRSGIATRLMDAVLARARELGYRALFLETGEAQPEALAFYPRHGWTPVERFPGDAVTYCGSSRFTRVL